MDEGRGGGRNVRCVGGGGGERKINTQPLEPVPVGAEIILLKSIE